MNIVHCLGTIMNTLNRRSHVHRSIFIYEREGESVMLYHVTGNI